MADLLPTLARCWQIWKAKSYVCLLLQTSTYTFRNTKELIDYQEGRYGSYEYGRYGNPTTRACEEKIRVHLLTFPLPDLLSPLLHKQ